MKMKVFLITFIYVFFIVLFLIVDFNDWLSFLNEKVNMSLLGDILGILTTIYLFLIAYYLIDKKISDNENERKTNKQNAFYIMLYDTYNECDYMIKLLDDDEYVFHHIVSKVDFNSIADPYLERQKSNIFKYDNRIYDFVSDGVVDDYHLKEYIRIKKLFSQYLNLKIAFHDIYLPKYDGIENANTAKKELQKMEKELKTSVNKNLLLISQKVGDANVSI